MWEGERVGEEGAFRRVVHAEVRNAKCYANKE